MIIKSLSISFILFSVITAKDLTLEVYVQKVINASYERYDLGLQSDEIEVQRRQLMAEYFPSLSYSLNSVQSKQGPREVFVGSVPISQPATTYEYHSTSFNLSQQIFDWGNSYRKKKSLNFKESLIKADYLQLARLMTDQALPFFFQLSEAIEVHEIFKQELSDTQKQQTHLNNLVDLGVKPPHDKLRIDITINEILSRIISQKMTITQLQAEVSFLMNESVDTTLTPVSLFDDNHEIDMSSSTNSANWRINYLNTQIKLSVTELSILKWDRLPDLYFSAGYSRGNALFESIYTDFDKDWITFFSFSLSFPLYSNNQQSLQENLKRIQIQRFTRRLKDEQNKIVKQNAILIEQIHAFKKKFELQEVNIKSFESIYTYELERYNSGLIEYQILNEAENSLLQSRQSLIALKYKFMENQEKLKLQLGEWDNVIYSTKTD